MTTRTDHATEAERAMRQVLNACETDENTGALVGIIAAQTHATLALVEQQRIANLIALASMAEDDSKHEVVAGTLGNEAVWTLATTMMNEPDDEFEIVYPNIAAALGIGADHG